jgi:cytoskeletal protein CcmA (bactofilin family)
MSFGKIIGKEDKETSNSTLNQLNANQSGSTSDKSKYEAVLGKGSKVVGNLNFTGPVEIGGHVEGEIIAQDRILITESAEINAKIIGSEVVIQGTVNGDIQASKKLTLKKPAKIYGNITCSNLSIEEGVVFEGKCSMDAAESDTSKYKSMPAPKVAGSI